jgi:hypothetical protein
MITRNLARNCEKLLIKGDTGMDTGTIVTNIYLIEQVVGTYTLSPQFITHRGVVERKSQQLKLHNEGLGNTRQ